MPTTQPQQEPKTHLAILIVLSGLVVSCFIGVPLALFVHAFIHLPIIAEATAGIAVGAFFGAVVMGLRATTRTPAVSAPEALELTVAGTAVAAPVSAPEAVHLTAAAVAEPVGAPEVVGIAAVAVAAAVSDPEAVDITAAAVAAPVRVSEAVDITAAPPAAPTTTPEAVDITAAPPAGPVTTPEPVDLTAAAVDASPGSAVPLQTRVAPSSSAIVGLLFSGPPTTTHRRTGPTRVRGATTNADLLGELLGFRPEPERELEELGGLPR
jgi:hypothetical protein